MKKKVFNYRKLIELIKKNFNIIASKTAIYDIINKMNITRKKIRQKKTYGNKLNINNKRKEFTNKIKNILFDNIISIDETSIDTTLKPIYGWGIKGNRVEIEVSSARKRVSLICAISNNNIIHYEIIKDTTTSEIFLNFIKNVINKCNKYKYLLMDNVRTHHSKILGKYINDKKKEIIFTPPYTPERNPIEKVFSVIKNKIRNLNFENKNQKLEMMIKRSLKEITDKKLNNFYISSLS